MVPDIKPRVVIELNSAHLDAITGALERLPCHDERFRTLGLECKAGLLVLLGKERSKDPWTRVPIENAAVRGPELTIFVNRDYVLKALSFGLNTLELIDGLSPLRFSRGGRQLVIMPLRGDAARPGPHQPASPPASLASNRPAATQATPPPRAESPPTQAMPETEETHLTQDGVRRISAADIARGTPSRDPAERSALETALAQLEAIRAGARETVAELTRLSDALKQAIRDQRISQRETQTMLTTLRSLQSLRL